jgi:MFS family permease
VTIEDLRACEPSGARQQTDTRAVLKRKLEKLDLSHVRALFATRQLAFSTSLIMTIWALIGLGYPLYNNFLPYLQSLRGIDFGDGSTNVTYRDTLVVAAFGIPGALLGGYLVEVPRFGRKGTLCLATLMTGGFLYGSTTARTSGALLGWNCGFNFSGSIMYSVLYAYTPEIFPTKDRGTGNALTATSNRVFGIMAVSSSSFLWSNLTDVL